LRSTHQAIQKEVLVQEVKEMALLEALFLEVLKVHNRIVSFKVSISSQHTTVKRIIQTVQVEYLAQELVISTICRWLEVCNQLDHLPQLPKCQVEVLVMLIANMNTTLKDLEIWATILNKLLDFLNAI